MLMYQRQHSYGLEQQVLIGTYTCRCCVRVALLCSGWALQTCKQGQGSMAKLLAAVVSLSFSVFHLSSGHCELKVYKSPSL